MSDKNDRARNAVRSNLHMFGVTLDAESIDKMVAAVLACWEPVGPDAPAPYVVSTNELVCQVAQAPEVIMGPGMIAPIHEAGRGTCVIHVDAVNRVYRVGVDHGQKISALVEDPGMRHRVSEAIDKVRNGNLLHSEKIDRVIDAVRGSIGGTSSSSTVDGREVREALGSAKPDNAEWTWNHAVAMVRELVEKYKGVQVERNVARDRVREVTDQRERCDRRIAELESKLHGVETALAATERDASNKETFHKNKVKVTETRVNEGIEREVNLQRMVSAHANTIDNLRRTLGEIERYAAVQSLTESLLRAFDAWHDTERLGQPDDKDINANKLRDVEKGLRDVLEMTRVRAATGVFSAPIDTIGEALRRLRSCKINAENWMEHERDNARRYFELTARQAIKIDELERREFVKPPKAGAPRISKLVDDAVRAVLSERGLPLDEAQLSAFADAVGQRSHAWICDYDLHNPREPMIKLELAPTSIPGPGVSVRS